MIGTRLLDLLGLDIPSVPRPTDRRAASRPYERAEMRKWFPETAQGPGGSDVDSKCSAARRHVMDAARTTQRDAGPGSMARAPGSPPATPRDAPRNVGDDPLARVLRRG